MHPAHANWTRGRLTALRIVIACAFALCTGAGLAHAQAAPVIDGNGADLITFANSLTGSNCGITFDDPRDDISIADPKIVVCTPLIDTDGNAVPDYFINGFDTRQFVFAYDRANQNLYLLWRTEGFIGDTDGNTNPDNNLCPPASPTFVDEPGIGSQENYQVRIDTNCDGAPDVIIGVGGVIGTDQVTVQGASIGGSTLAYRAGGGASGQDLEVQISGISLPGVFLARGNSNASFDGLGEDITSEQGCTPGPSIDIEKSVNVPSICVGGTADFTLVVTNNGDVDLTGVTVVDQLPSGLVYQSTQSNTCGGGVNAVGNTITYGPFNLAAGASCTIVLRVGRTAECSGTQTNNATVEAVFQSPCFNDNKPTTVSDTDAASIECASLNCSITAPDTSVCGTETVQICGPEGNYTYAWSTGATTRCINVGAGTYSLVITDPVSGCQSTGGGCSVTITPGNPPVCSISAPDTRVCGNETVQICGPEGTYTYLWNTGATTRCITVGVGTYSLVITDATSGCQSSNPCAVTITPDNPPVCSIPPVTICPGETTELCGPEGNYSYDWSTGATTRCITVGAGTYSLVITDTVTGCSNSGSPCSVTVTEDPNAPNCAVPACPRTPGFWGQQCDQKNNGSAKFTKDEVSQIAGLVDQVSDYFDWADDFAGFCSVVKASGSMNLQKQAARHFAAMLANYATDQLDLSPDNGEVIILDPSTPVDCAGLDADTIGELIEEVDELLSTGSSADYGAIVSCLDAINNGTNIPVDCDPDGENGDGAARSDLQDQPGAESELFFAAPNPFTHSTRFAFNVGEEAGAKVDIAIYDVAGRRVKVLLSGQQPGGSQYITWDGTDAAGARVPRGVYFVRSVIAGVKAPVQRLLYLR